ncbi:hypothetical protein AcV7_004128 [Taiwanofungus camphoratus]|nr:hypothetical protein AcV7_004128 [Antrodia cinnamomea]
MSSMSAIEARASSPGEVATPNDDIALIGDADEITVDMLKQLEAADEYQVQAAANKPVAQFITNLLPGGHAGSSAPVVIHYGNYQILARAAQKLKALPFIEKIRNYEKFRELKERAKLF